MKIIHSLLIASLLLMFGCASEGPYIPSGANSSVESKNSAVLLDKELIDVIAVDQQKETPTRRGKLKALSTIRNRVNQDVTIQVQTVFRDAEGFSIEDDTAWETLVLTANESRDVTAISASKKARRFTTRIRMVR